LASGAVKPEPEKRSGDRWEPIHCACTMHEWSTVRRAVRLHLSVQPKATLSRVVLAERRDLEHVERDLFDAPVLVKLEVKAIAVALDHVARAEGEVLASVAGFGEHDGIDVDLRAHRARRDRRVADAHAQTRAHRVARGRRGSRRGAARRDL